MLADAEPQVDVVNFDFSDLPSFVDHAGPRDENGDPNFWNVAEVGHYDTDIQRGLRLGHEALAYSHRHNCPQIIGFTLRSIMRSGRFGPVEIGFIAEISTAASAGRLN